MEGEGEREGEGGREILKTEGNIVGKEKMFFFFRLVREREGGNREGGRGREGVMDIMWPIRQSHFHISCLCSLNEIYSLSFLCDVCNEVYVGI